MNSTIEKQANGTIKLAIKIPWSEVEKTTQEITNEAVKHTEVPGFRKGKAPKKMAEESLSQESIREEVLKKLLPQAYLAAIKEHGINPIINPKIHVEKLEKDKDWEFSALTCEMPKIDLGSYKENIKTITAKSKIVVPGKPQEEPKFDDIVKALLDSVKIEIPEVLLDQEVDRLLSQTLDEIKRLGLSLDQYLASTGKNIEVLKNDYKAKASGDIKLEFTLQKIAEEEKITVDEKEIEEAILRAKDAAERKNLEGNRYLLAAILRQQKTLDFLKNL